MELFRRIFKHYIVLALSQAGCSVDGDVIGEIEAACDDLEDYIGLEIQKAIIACCGVWETKG